MMLKWPKQENGIVVVPDVLANAGGVTVSYFEWVQGLQSFFWTEQEVNSKLDQIMKRAYDQVAASCAIFRTTPWKKSGAIVPACYSSKNNPHHTRILYP